MRASRAAFHSHHGSQHAMWSSPRSRIVQWSLCVSNSGVVINDGDDIPPAWRCESCRQTTVVDGVAPRSARRGFGEPHFSVKFDGDKRPHSSVLRSSGFLKRNLLSSVASLPVLADTTTTPTGVFLDPHNTQRGEAQLAYKNGGLSLPKLCLPASHPITVDQCLEKAVEVRV